MKKMFLFVAAFMTFGLLSIQAQVTETVLNSGQWVVPANVSSITVEAWGGGGPGRPTDGPWTAPGGGGGGAYASSVIAVTPGQVIDIVVGAGGVGTASSFTDGGDTWVISAATLLAKGGKVGQLGPDYFGFQAIIGGAGGAGGAGGLASESIGDIKFNGGNGAAGSWTILSGYGGGGGSAPGDGLPGVNATDRFGAVGPMNPEGNGGNGATYGNNGQAGVFPGGGGGAGRGTQGVSDITQNGGNGANGLVLIHYTEDEVPPIIPISNWALFIGLGLMVAFMVVRFRKVI